MTERETTITKLPQDYDSPTNSDNSTVRTQAAFVNKLYKMLEDFNIHHLISWSDRGDSFSVSNPTSFSKIVLPQYFKHNNWQSFVRQLNMYGFHKVNDMIHSNLNSDNQTWEFKHPHFKRGEIDDLQNIKRKSTKPIYSNLPARVSNASRIQSNNDEDIYGPMYKHMLHIEDRLHHVSRSYEILKNETNSLRGLLTKQQQTISEFTTLLVQVVQEEANAGFNETKKESILTKLNELQTLISSGTATTTTPSQTLNMTNGSGSSPNLQINYIEQDPSTKSHLRSRRSFSSQSSSSTSCSPVITQNKRLGFGKESHLLNPEPAYPSNGDTRSIDDNYIKKRRTK